MILINRFYILYISCIFLSLSCKEKFSWNLRRSGYYDSKQNVKDQQYKLYNCESYEDFQFIVNGSPSNWLVSPYGYTGSGFALLGNRSLTKVILNTSCNKESVIAFWVKSSNQGYQGKVPNVLVNGKLINTSIITGELVNWFRIQTSSVPAGSINMEIEFESQQTIWNYYIDEVVIYVSDK